MAIKSLAQTLKDLATGIKNTITGVTGSNATLTITKGNGTTNTVTVNNVANATNADKLDGYHYTDIINNAKTSVSSGVMGAPNWSGKITANGHDTQGGFTAPTNGFCYSGIDSTTHYINDQPISIVALIPVKKGDKFRTYGASVTSSVTVYFVPCS